MKTIKRIIAAVMVMMMAMTQMVYAEETVQTVETTQAVQESPDMWALWNVQMANTYGLGEDTIYSAYRETVSGDVFKAVLDTLEDKFGVDDKTIASGSRLARANVIKELYDIMTLAIDGEVKGSSLDEIVDYYVDNDLMAGREDGDYALFEPCTRQEMFVFAKRAYDHIVYTLKQEAKGIFWQVSDEDNTVYLLGSIHVVDDSTYPLARIFWMPFSVQVRWLLKPIPWQ